tara:strand:+ start:207 stop:557 length:351 start_codon:yes stop_codon:yes gene_type:complete
VPHDLKAERIDRNLKRLRAALGDSAPELQPRFDAYLAELLNGETMSDTPTSMRLPEAWLETAEDLAKHYQRNGQFAAFGTMTRATVLRLALQEGLKVLDEQRKADDQAFIDGIGGR